MKILLVNYEFPGVTANCGGGGEVTKQLADGLLDRGHKVEIFTDEADGSYLTFPVRTYRELRERVDLFEPDVIHGCFSIPTSVLLPKISREFGVPLVVSVMGADVYDPTRYKWIRPVLDACNRHVLSAADAVVSPSTDMAARVRRKYALDPDVIHYGIDADAWDWTRRDVDAEVRLLSVSRLVDRKNLENAVRAVGKLRESGVNATFTIVGKGPSREKLSALKAKRGYDWLELAGYVPDLQETFDTHDVFFLPSEHEAFGMVFLEALASGLPVVTTSTGGQSDILRDGELMPGALAESDSPEELAETICGVVAEYVAYQERTGGYVSSLFSRENMVSGYEAVYERVNCD